MPESKKRTLSFSFCYKITLAKKGTQINANPDGALRFCFKNEGIE